jgi:hypothetical protein
MTSKAKVATKAFAIVALIVAAASCAGQRVIVYPAGCAERLSLPYKQAECMACVSRPVPHQYLPDQPDGTRCAPR